MRVSPLKNLVVKAAALSGAALLLTSCGVQQSAKPGPKWSDTTSSMATVELPSPERHYAPSDERTVGFFKTKDAYGFISVTGNSCSLSLEGDLINAGKGSAFFNKGRLNAPEDEQKGVLNSLQIQGEPGRSWVIYCGSRGIVLCSSTDVDKIELTGLKDSAYRDGERDGENTGKCWEVEKKR